MERCLRILSAALLLHLGAARISLADDPSADDPEEESDEELIESSTDLPRRLVKVEELCHRAPCIFLGAVVSYQEKRMGTLLGIQPLDVIKSCEGLPPRSKAALPDETWYLWVPFTDAIAAAATVLHAQRFLVFAKPAQVDMVPVGLFKRPGMGLILADRLFGTMPADDESVALARKLCKVEKK